MSQYQPDFRFPSFQSIKGILAEGRTVGKLYNKTRIFYFRCFDTMEVVVVRKLDCEAHENRDIA